MSAPAKGPGAPPLSVPERIALSLGLLVIALEYGLYLLRQRLMPQGVVRLLRESEAAKAGLASYLEARAWCIEHPLLASLLGVTVLGLSLLAYRYLLLLWHNQLKARLSGTYFQSDDLSFKQRSFDLLAELAKRPAGSTFVGLVPRSSTLGFTSYQPLYLSSEQRSTHRHVMGKTGSGKTQSVIWVQCYQDALDGKGQVVADAKGSDENIRVMKGIARAVGREQQLRIFALPAWNQPDLFSHTYNMVWVRPRTPTDPGGDPSATAERVFSVLPLGNNEYYNTQAQVMFVNLCKLLHGIVDERGFGIPFNMQDLAVCLKGIGASDDWGRALKSCLQRSVDRYAAQEIQNQISRLGNEVQKCFSGVIGAVDKFQSAIVNAYDPDIIFEEVLEKSLLVYVQLPANLFKLQAPAMGRVMLQDIQQEGSLRQVFRNDVGTQKKRSQGYFAVTIDEFYNFADITIVDSLNKLRDANLQFTLAHQSMADLDLVSKEFTSAVWDNTRCKDILKQDNPQLCEQLAKSIGTHQIIEKTVRAQAGELFTSLNTGDASTKLVEAYRLHPNSIKTLGRCGQGYSYTDDGIRPVVYGTLPKGFGADYPLPRKDQRKAPGLRLAETFFAGSSADSDPSASSSSSPKADSRA